MTLPKSTSKIMFPTLSMISGLVEIKAKNTLAKMSDLGLEKTVTNI